MVQNKESLEVDPKTNKNPNEDAFKRYMDTEVGILRSRTVVEQVITRMNLTESSEFRSWKAKITTYLASRFVSGHPETAELERTKKEDAIVKAMDRRMRVRQVGKGQLIEVDMDASSPEMAQSMLKTYLDVYLDTKVNIEHKGDNASLGWLKEEIKHVQQGILDSESALVRFIAEHGIVPSDDGGLADVVDIIKKQQEGVIKAQELKAKLQGIQKGSGSARYNTATELGDDEVLKKLKENLANLEAEYNQIIGTYSEDHPRAVLLRRRIRTLGEKLAATQNQALESALQAAKKQAEILTKGVATAKEEVVRIGGLGAAVRYPEKGCGCK